MYREETAKYMDALYADQICRDLKHHPVVQSSNGVTWAAHEAVPNNEL